MEFALAAGALAGDSANKAAEWITAVLVDENVLPEQVHQLSQYIGDIPDTYFIAAATDFLISSRAPHAPRWVRRTASVATSATAGLIAELPKLNAAASQIIPHSLLGTADLKDLVGAFAGTAIWLAVNIYANRQQNPTTPEA